MSLAFPSRVKYINRKHRVRVFATRLIDRGLYEVCSFPSDSDGPMSGFTDEGAMSWNPDTRHGNHGPQT